MANDQAAYGNKEERKVFTDVIHHYQMAKEDLDVRRPDFDKKDILFRSHIEKGSWPYRAVMFDPRIFTTLYEKTARLVANKPQGRMVPREGGDALGAKINNELLSFQWDDNERADGTPMIAKWALMDLTARKYGASFALVKWHYERRKDAKSGRSDIWYDGPNFKPLNNRDVLANPSYPSVKNWFQHRDYLTIQDMAAVNDSSRSKPVYKNLDLLKKVMDEDNRHGGDKRESDYVVKNKSLKGLQDYLGRDSVYRTVEVVTEYRNDRWITFSPKHGVILRDIPNPYDHGQIPVVQLKYYPIDDDLYGLSEIEPVEKIQRAVNALLSQYLDTVNATTYPIVKVKSTGGAVQLHTLEFKPGAKWMMQNPDTDVQSLVVQPTGVREFPTTYRLLIGSMQEALGETSQGISNLAPGESNKTATEVKDLATSRSARDNFNQIFLSEAIKKQHMLWHKMNQQFLFQGNEKQKVIRIVGKDAIKYFQDTGLDGEGLNDDSIEMLSDPDVAETSVTPEDVMQPLYPVQTPEGVIPKFNLEEGGQFGSLILEPEDLSGNYDFIPDVGSMAVPDEAQMINARKSAVELALNPASVQLLMQDEYKLKFKELFEDLLEEIGLKDADKYFEKLQVQDMNAQIDPATGQPIVPAGAGGVVPGQQGMVNGQQPGMVGGSQAVPNGQAQPILP